MKLSEALKIAQAPPPAGARKLSLYLACGFTPLHLSTFLAAYLRAASPAARGVEIEVGGYGDLAGNLLRLQQSSCDGAAVVVEWPDLDPRLGLRGLGGWAPAVLPDVEATVVASAGRILRLLEGAARAMPVAVCLPTLPLPPISYLPLSQSGAFDLSLRKSLQDFALSAAGIPGVKLVSQQRLDEVSPLSERLDVKSELMAGFPYKLPHASSVAELLARLVEPCAPKKGLITDLDDTLWRGILGEDGVRGISWELDAHSHAHALYQQLLAALSESGVLIGVASKNDPILAAEAMAREDLLLSRERIFPLEINWGRKSESIGRILRAWNVGADAVVFVDDSPLELAEVKSLYPEMECLLFTKNDDRGVHQLLWKLRDLFGKQAILEEDAIRAESLRRAADFRDEAAGATARALDDFLTQVEAEASFSPIDADGEARAFELINKTNQFNLNGRRLSEAEFRAALNRSGAVSLLVSYRDKFGPLGKVAALLGRVESSAIRVETWVMSCRAFGRQLEHKCIEYLFERWGAKEIELDYRPTERNGPAREFLLQFSDDCADGPCKIRREIFAGRKPALFQDVSRTDHA